MRRSIGSGCKLILLIRVAVRRWLGPMACKSVLRWVRCSEFVGDADTTASGGAIGAIMSLRTAIG